MTHVSTKPIARPVITRAHSSRTRIATLGSLSIPPSTVERGSVSRPPSGEYSHSPPTRVRRNSTTTAPSSVDGQHESAPNSPTSKWISKLPLRRRGSQQSMQSMQSLDAHIGAYHTPGPIIGGSLKSRRSFDADGSVFRPNSYLPRRTHSIHGDELPLPPLMGSRWQVPAEWATSATGLWQPEKSAFEDD